MSQSGSNTSGGGGGGGIEIFSQSTTLTANQILNLQGTPVQVFTALGANKFPVITSIVLQLVYNTTPYTLGSGGPFAFYWTNPSNPDGSAYLAAVSGFIDDTSSQIQTAVFSTPVSSAAMAVNAPMVLTQSGSGEFADGDSPIIVTIFYTILTTAVS